MNNKTMVGLIFSHMDNKNGKGTATTKLQKHNPKIQKPTTKQPNSIQTKNKKLSNQTQTQPTQFKPKKIIKKTKKINPNQTKTQNHIKPKKKNNQTKLEPTLKKKEAKSISNQNTKPAKKQDNIIHDKENIRQGPKTGDSGRRGGESGLSCKVRKAADPTLTCTHLSLSLLSHSLCLIFVVGNCIVCWLGTHSEGRAKP
jgi:hypothetical protein